MDTEIILDIETTGIGAGHRICAIALIEGEERSTSLIHPQRKIPPAASAIHHITNEAVRDAPSFAHSPLYTRMRALNTPQSLLIAHHLPFVLSMLSHEGIIWQGASIDTHRCARALMDDLEGYGLQYLRYELRLYREEEHFFAPDPIIPHHPLSDALHVQMLYGYLRSLASREELIALSHAPILLQRFPFGKYAHQPIETVVQYDRRYVEWLLHLDDLDEDLRYSLHYYLSNTNVTI